MSDDVTLTNGDDGFGGASLENQFEGYKFFKLAMPDPKKGEESTELVLRLLPAMHSYKADKKWKFFYAQHYGYFGVNARNPEKPRSRPFGCRRRKDRNGNVTTHCVKCQQVDKYHAQRKAREAELLKSSGLDEKSIEFKTLKKNDAELTKLAQWLKKHNTSKKFWINAMDANGVFGVLQLSYTTCETVLTPLLKRLQAEGYDAFDPNKGLWLRFIRSGSGVNVKDTVEVVTEPVDVGGGRKAMIYKEAPMTAEQKAKAVKVCPDLAKDVVKFISDEQVAALVACNGDPEAVDKIWPPERSGKQAAEDEGAGDDDASEPEGSSMLTSNVPASTAAAAATADVTTQQEQKVEAPTGSAASAAGDLTEEQLQAMLAAIKAKRQPQESAPTKAPAMDPVDARAAFIKNFGTPAAK